MSKIKNLTIISVAMLSQIALAADASVGARAEIVSSLYTFVTIMATAMGMMLMISALVKLKKRADNPNDPKSFPTSIIVTLFAGAMAFNYSNTAGTIISSLLGSADAGYCFVMDAETSGDVLSENCWTAEGSEMLGSIEERVNKMSENDAGTQIKENAETIIALFQTIGLIYFLKGLYGLKVTSEGQSREGYGKPIITLIASALVIDLPHTIELVQGTITYLGFGV